jgi:hypothetical protein
MQNGSEDQVELKMNNIVVLSVSEDQVELKMNNIVVLSVKITSRSTCINSNYVILSVEIIYITHITYKHHESKTVDLYKDRINFPRINFHSVILKIREPGAYYRTLRGFH